MKKKQKKRYPDGRPTIARRSRDSGPTVAESEGDSSFHCCQVFSFFEEHEGEDTESPMVARRSPDGSPMVA